MMHILIQLSLSIILGFCINVYAKRNYGIEITNLNYTIQQPELITNLTVNCYREKSQSKVYFEVVLQQLVKNFRTHVTAYKLRSDGTKMSLMTVDLDGCRFLKSVYRHNLLPQIIEELRRVSNIPQKCPVPPKKYIIDNFTINTDKYPAFMPIMDWIISFDTWIDDKRAFELIVQGNIHKN